MWPHDREMVTLPPSSTKKPEYGVMATVGFGSLTTLIEKEIASLICCRAECTCRSGYFVVDVATAIGF